MYRGLTVSEGEAKGTVEAKLRKQQLTKPMTETQLTAFCQAMVKNLELDPSDTDKIRAWTKDWQAAFFRPTGR